MKNKCYNNFFSLITNFRFGLLFFLIFLLLDTILYLGQKALITNLFNIIGSSVKSFNLIFNSFLYLVILTGMYELFRSVKSFYISTFIAKLKKAIDINLVAQIIDYEEAFFTQFGSPMILTAVRNITDGIEDACEYLKNVLTSIFFLIGSIYYLYFITPSFAYITIFWSIIWLIISNFILKITYKYAVKSSEYRRILGLNLGDVFSNMFTIKTFNTGKQEKERNALLSNQVYIMYQKGNIIDFILDLISTFLYLLFFVSYLYFLYHLWILDKIKIGEIMLVIHLINDIYRNLDDFNDYLSEFIGMMGQVNDGLKVINKGKNERIVNQSKNLSVIKGEIILRNIKYKYDGQDLYQLELDGELCIKSGTTVAMVGTSGGGKTTFFKILLGLIFPNEGDIIIDGQNILECSVESIRSAFALVPQDVGLFQRSVLDNIKYGAINATKEEISEVLENTNLTELINSLEKGCDSIIGENTEFSGGQKQRIMLARGLLRKAKIFLFDESTSALDAKNENEILSHIDRITKGYTKFVIAHRLKTVEMADLILVFDKGKIIEKGTHKELLRLNGLYSELVNLL